MLLKKEKKKKKALISNKVGFCKSYARKTQRNTFPAQYSNDVIRSIRHTGDYAKTPQQINKNKQIKSVSFLMDDSSDNSDLSHLSIISNGLSIEEDRIKNPLGVLPY